MTDQGIELGARLRRQRESRALSVHDVSKVTKIPEKSVVLLEAGAFDELPGEVFVRGFLKSYCKSVGLDVEATLRDYGELTGKGPRPRREPSLVRPGVGRGADSESAVPVAATRAAPSAPVPAVAAAPAAPAAPAVPELSPEEKARIAEQEREERLFSSLRGAGQSSSRLPLTLALIILVIVATVTLSLLLRGPGHVSGVSLSLRP